MVYCSAIGWFIHLGEISVPKYGLLFCHWLFYTPRWDIST